MPVNRLLGRRLAIAAALIFSSALFGYTISQETPVGAIRGSVVAQESGNPLECWVSLTKPGERRAVSTHSSDGSYNIARIPAGEYTMQVRSNHRHSPPIKVRIDEGRTETLNVELAPGAPFVDLYIHQHIFTPAERPQITCRGYTESDALDMRIYRVDQDAFLVKAGGSLHRLLGVDSYNYGDYGTRTDADLASNQSLALVDSFHQAIGSREADGVFTRRIDLPRLGPGLYVVAAKGDNVQKLGWLMVTSLGLVAKTASPQVLAFAVDLKSGEPVASVDVKVYSGQDQVASGKTGPNGLADLKLPGGNEGGSQRTIVARSGDSFAFVSAYMSSTQSPGNVIYAYTDRPVYRPGHKVLFRGVARKFSGDAYTVLASKQVAVEVRDPRDNLVYRGVKTTDRFGCYHGEFDLNSETATGDYSLVSSIDGEGREEGAYFRVAAYSKPEFSVKVSFDKKRCTRGQNVTARINASYYFGAPVANAKVSYVIRRAPYWLFEGDEEDFYFDGEYEGYGGYGEWIQEDEVTTDANGVAEVAFRADWDTPDEEDGWDTDQQFTVEAYVTDKSRREAEGSGAIVATRGDFAVDVTPDRYVIRPGSPVRVRIQARDYDKRPVRNQEVSLVIGREYWTENESRFDRFEERSVRTDNSGRAEITFRPRRSGSIRVTATSRDRRGNRIINSAYVWCYSDAWEDSATRFPDLQIVMDKKTYQPGDTAKVLINTNRPGKAALVTVEGPRIYDRLLVQLRGRSTEVEVPIRGEYKPNFYIGVCFVRNKSFVSQEARAKVSLGAQSLRVSITPDKRRYLPGEKAAYTIRTTGSDGKPVSAELSLGVVDEAIYGIATDRTTPIGDYFYSRKSNDVQTHFSFPEIYLSDPNKATAAMPRRALSDVYTRKRFLDTAFWKPDIVTDASGRASVSFDLPDNLTTWRATVRAVTADTCCGQATDSVLAQQDMLIRLETPRFLVQDDSTTLSAVVHNYTGQDQDVGVSFSAPGLSVDGNTRPRVRVRSGGSERLDWQVRAPKPGDYPVTVQAKCRVTGDAMQIVLPVRPHGQERTTAFTGDLAGKSSASLSIPVRRDSVPGATCLRLRLAPSLASAMLGSLDYLAQYPYGCTEQTTSSFIPDVILSQSMNDLGIRDARLERDLPEMVRTGLFRLYRMQLEDGGWSWCEYGKADLWMTAYVCYGLLSARNAGFPVSPDVLSRGLDKLSNSLNTRQPRLREKAYGYYVLTLDPNRRQQGIGGLSQNGRRIHLENRIMALVALGFAQAGDRDKAAAALSRLYRQAISDSGALHWTDGSGYRPGDIETTALALRAALKVDPRDQRVYQMVRWLMRERQGNCWYSTRDTAMTLYAMADFLRATKEFSPDCDADVLVNGRQIARVHFGGDSVFQPDTVVDIAAKDLRRGRNSVEIRRSGTGNVYYSAQLTQYVASKSTAATVTGAGVTIGRTYYKPGRAYHEGSGAKGLGSPVTGCRGGDVILVRLTVDSSKRLERLMLEDYLPAGCEVVDKGHVEYWEWDYWWVGRDIRDDKISFYLDSLSPGRHVVTYRMRAGIPGKYRAMPAQLWAMYDPRVRATTSEVGFDVR